MRGGLSFLLLIPSLLLLRCSGAELGILASAVLCHELGHLLAARCCGGALRGAALSPAGLTLDLGCERMPYKKEIAVHLAGPLANLLLLLPAFFLIRHGLTEARLFFFFCNGLLALFHLLPVRGLDGGRALYCALCLFVWPETASRTVGLVGGGVLLLLCLASLLLLFRFHNPSLAVLCLSLCLEEGEGRQGHKKRGTKYPRSS